MKKLIIFDLDGTLAELAKPITAETIKGLNNLADLGHIIAICSGKPTYYLCGMLRQTGISNPVYIGENGATLQFGVDLPPKKTFVYPHNADSKSQIKLISSIIRKRCNDDIWCQPNEFTFTPFPKNKMVFDEIRNIIAEYREQLKDLTIYEHGDCFDFIPKEISKQNGVKFLANLLGISSENIIAVGDGVNDYSMFEYAGMSVGINLINHTKATHNVSNIADALAYIIENC